MRASISEAKNGLSALLDRVRAGARVVIEDRGVPIARLEPLGAPGATEGRLARLERAGLVRAPRAKVPRGILAAPPPRARGRAAASAALIDERRSGR